MFAELVGVPLGTGPVKGVLRLLWCRRKEPHPICRLVVRTPLKAWHLLSTCCVPGTVLSAVNVKLTHSYSEQPSGSQAHLPLAPCPCCALCEAYCSYGSSLGMPDSKLSLQRDLFAYLWPPVIDCSHLTRIFFIMHCSIWNCLFFFYPSISKHRTRLLRGKYCVYPPSSSQHWAMSACSRSSVNVCPV